MPLIFKVLAEALWREAEAAGFFKGSDVDKTDGFIHFSKADQVHETVAKHFADQDDLVIVAVEEALLGPALRYEKSRGGNDFPHLYGDLPLSAVRWIKRLILSPEGYHVFPDLSR